MHKLFAAMLAAVGKTYTLDPRVPSGLLLHEIGRRVIWGLRGLWRTRRRIFMGPGVALRGRGLMKAGRYVTIEERCRIDAYGEWGVQLGDRTKLGAYTIIGSTNHLGRFGKGVKIGKDSGVGQYSFFGAAGGIDIGDNVIMGQYVSFHASNHNFEEDDRPIREQGVNAKGIKIENDVWVGAKVTFLDGAHIGAHSVVAAGAVVRGEFPPNSIIGGVPAKLIKTRNPAAHAAE